MPNPNARCGGRSKKTRSSVALTGRCLPVRRKNGTPDQRHVSMSTRRAMNVSVVDPGFTPTVSR